MGVPHTAHYRRALQQGNTLPGPSCIHWVRSPPSWLGHQRDLGFRIVGVELADEAIRLADLRPAGGPTVVVLGHEHRGIPDDVWDLLDDVVEIPMVGRGASLNVAVAGSLVLYKLAGLS